MSHKCLRCGTEFEGNFCPECGERWLEEKQCPQCGTTLPGSTKFCNNCGYSFLAQRPAAPVSQPAYTPAPQPEPQPAYTPAPQPEPQPTYTPAPQPTYTPAPQPEPQPTYTPAAPYSPAPTAPVYAPSPSDGPAQSAPVRTSFLSDSLLQKIYALCRNLPAILSGVVALLSFLFYLAPVAIMPGGELLGEKIPSESYGNVYQSLSGEIFPKYMGVLLIVFSGLLLVSAALAMFFAYRRSDTLERVLKIGGDLFLFVLFVIACVIIGGIAKQDEGMGLIKAGAAPILLLIATLLCFLAVTAAIGIEIWINIFHSDIRDRYEDALDEREPLLNDTRLPIFYMLCRYIPPALCAIFAIVWLILGFLHSEFIESVFGHSTSSIRMEFFLPVLLLLVSAIALVLDLSYHNKVSRIFRGAECGLLLLGPSYFLYYIIIALTHHYEMRLRGDQIAVFVISAVCFIVSVALLVIELVLADRRPEIERQYEAPHSEWGGLITEQRADMLYPICRIAPAIICMAFAVFAYLLYLVPIMGFGAERSVNIYTYIKDRAMNKMLWNMERTLAFVPALVFLASAISIVLGRLHREKASRALRLVGCGLLLVLFFTYSLPIGEIIVYGYDPKTLLPYILLFVLSALCFAPAIAAACMEIWIEARRREIEERNSSDIPCAANETGAEPLLEMEKHIKKKRVLAGVVTLFFALQFATIALNNQADILLLVSGLIFLASIIVIIWGCASHVNDGHLQKVSRHRCLFCAIAILIGLYCLAAMFVLFQALLCGYPFPYLNQTDYSINYFISFIVGMVHTIVLPAIAIPILVVQYRKIAKQRKKFCAQR